MSSPDVEILRGLLDVERGLGPDTLAAALFTHHLIGPNIPFTFEVVRDSIAAGEAQYRSMVEAIAAEIVNRIAAAMKSGLRH